MNSFLRFPLLPLLLLLAFLPATASAAQMPAERRLDRLNSLVSLSRAQADQALRIFERENVELDRLSGVDLIDKGGDIRTASREAIRALLTPAQQHIYDRAPQGKGGGVTLALPENRVARLADQVGGLNAQQRAVALQVYTEEFESLVAIPQADRMVQGAPFRKAASDQIRKVLNPDQQAKFDATMAATRAVENAERAAVDAFLKQSPAISARVGAVQKIESTGTSVISETTTTSEIAGTKAPVAVAAGQRQGKFNLIVTGSTGTETFGVYWTKATPTAPVQVAKIETASGEALKL